MSWLRRGWLSVAYSWPRRLLRVARLYASGHSIHHVSAPGFTGTTRLIKRLHSAAKEPCTGGVEPVPVHQAMEWIRVLQNRTILDLCCTRR